MATKRPGCEAPGISGKHTGQAGRRRNGTHKKQTAPVPESPNAVPRHGPSLFRFHTLTLPVAIFISCSFLLCWNLDSKYLWQDEAATAILGERMLTYGRPLGYDGRNLITMDLYRPEDESRLPTSDPDEAVRYFAGCHHFKKDTTWTAHPWGPFAIAGMSLALLGKNTLAARLPFALAGAFSVALLFFVVRKYFRSPLPALVAAALLAGNTFWFLHMRQCRYYALSSLFLLVTLYCYLRWQEGKRWGAPAFVAAVWVWFHQDFGSPWPALVIFALDSVVLNWKDRKRLAKAALVFAVVGITVGPFVLYYEMVNRPDVTSLEWSAKLWIFLLQTNQFLIPLVMIPLALFFLWKERPEKGEDARRLIILSIGIICASIPWMSRMVAAPSFRYIVPLTSLCAIISAYVIAAVARSISRARSAPWLTVSVTTAIAALLIVTNLLCVPGGWAIPGRYRMPLYTSTVIRPELNAYMDNLRGYGPDPNRATVDYLKERLSPEDEVICNYEDMPLIFYLGNPIRGGIGCFRLTDTGTVPKYAVLRMSALGITHRAIYERALSKYAWMPHPLDVPDVLWGNNPDPISQFTLMSLNAPPLRVYEHIEEHR